MSEQIANRPPTRRPPGPVPGTIRRGPAPISPEVLAARSPFARALVTQRIEHDLTQLDLAKLTKVPTTSIASYEIGVIRPGPTSRAKLEAVIGDLPPFTDEDVPALTPAQLEQARKQLGLTDAE